MTKRFWLMVVVAAAGSAVLAQWQGNPTPRASTGLVPLTDMKPDDRYKGETGGLYGDGHNAPPQSHLEAGQALAKALRPAQAGGSVALVAIGMSNTTQEFQALMPMVAADAHRAPWVKLVDGAQGGADAAAWSTNPQVWTTLDQRLRNAGVRPEEVGLVWIKQALAGPARYGAYPGHANALADHLRLLVQRLRQRFPNLRVAFLSSRIYAGWASSPLNPEPYAYEGAFAVRNLIAQQVAGDAALNWDAAKGEVKAPLLLWGPYLWADGDRPRADKLAWPRDDLGPDGTHPSNTGREKVAKLLLGFLQTDPVASLWYQAPAN